MSPEVLAAESRRRRAQAADWLFRLRDPEISPAEISAWIAWCDASPSNKQEFSVMQSLWQQSAVSKRAAAPALASLNIPASAGVRRPVSRVSRLAAPREKFLRRYVPQKSWAIAAGIGAIVVVLALWFVQLQNPLRNHVTLATTAGVNRDVTLPDGSVVSLGGGSRLVTNFNGRQRGIVLENGEAYFRVAKDPNRPFIVSALNATVTAVGTAFNVRAEQGIVKVAVTEGTVDVERQQARGFLGTAKALDTVSTPRIENIRVIAGHQITFLPDNPRPIVVATDTERAIAWLSGTLQFEREPLSSVVAAVNRYAATPIELGSSALERFNYTGTVAADRIDEWLHGLPDIYPVEVRERNDGSFVIDPIE